MKRYIFLLLGILTITLSTTRADAVDNPNVTGAVVYCDAKSDGNCTFYDPDDAYRFLIDNYGYCGAYEDTKGQHFNGAILSTESFSSYNNEDNPHYVEYCEQGAVIEQSKSVGVGLENGQYLIDCLKCTFGEPIRDKNKQFTCFDGTKTAVYKDASGSVDDTYSGIGTKCPPPACDGPEGSQYCITEGDDKGKHWCPKPAGPWTFTLGGNGFLHQQTGIDYREVVMQAWDYNFQDEPLDGIKQCTLLPLSLDGYQGDNGSPLALFENDIGYGYFDGYDISVGCFYE